MDRIDSTTLSVLQKNSGILNVDLTLRAGLLEFACLRRVSRLEKSGIIDGYHANLNAARMGNNVLVLKQITLRGQLAQMMAKIRDRRRRHPRV